MIDDEPWFVAKDVCEILEIQNPTQAADRLDEDERAMFNIGRQGETNIVSESGLYSLTLGSKKPESKPFKRWITHEVIPAIRKTGSYSVKPMTPIQMLAAQAQAMAELESKVNSTNDRLNGAVEALAAPSPINWQTETGNKIRRVCKENGLSYLVEFGALYEELENQAHVNLQSRVDRLKGRMKKSGHTFKECNSISKLHVISNDPVLKLAFDGIVRRFSAKYATKEGEKH